MSVPLNGRIAIVENDLKEAMPLFQMLSQNEMPYVFYQGNERKFLPEKNSSFNDIRLLFLDLNLIDKGKPNVRDIKSTLYGVLSRIISKDNYPYSVILWSKQESDYADVLRDLFSNELKDRAPISINPFLKSDFFTLDGTELDNQLNLIQEVNNVLSKDLAYSYLLHWENNVHLSTDKTLHEVFSSCHTQENWSNNANYLINTLGKSYAGGGFSSQKPEEKLISSHNALNLVLNDTLENSTNTKSINGAKELLVTDNLKNRETVSAINSKLLTSNEKGPLNYSGALIEVSDPKREFENILDKVLNKPNKKQEILDSYRTIWLNVTPLCDTVQGKIVFHRLVRGLLVKADFVKPEKKIFHQNEAIFVSPVFAFDNEDRAILLDFRQFFTLPKLGQSKNRSPLFRVRQQLLAEIQSRLARHINRQGVLFLNS